MNWDEIQKKMKVIEECKDLEFLRRMALLQLGQIAGFEARIRTLEAQLAGQKKEG